MVSQSRPGLAEPCLDGSGSITGSDRIMVEQRTGPGVCEKQNSHGKVTLAFYSRVFLVDFQRIYTTALD